MAKLPHGMEKICYPIKGKESGVILFVVCMNNYFLQYEQTLPYSCYGNVERENDFFKMNTLRMMKKIKSIALVFATLSILIGGTACDETKNKESNTTAESTESVDIANNSNTTNKENEMMKFELLTLPYASDALEPVIGKATIEYHHGKHLNTYVTNLNKLIEGTEFAGMELEEIVKKSEGGIFNNAGQTLNHNLYFTQFSPKGGGQPSGDLLAAIEKKFGSFDNFKKEYEAAATTLFGAGWAWLATDKEGNLEITKEQNAGNPITKGLTPLLGADVWEHAYYLDFQNRRADHVAKLWDIIDWNVVGERYSKR